ncbi:hypothetical protein QF043_003601 [Pseudomonas sp. W3I7]|nr:hypothetical protein [Pseudomonas sp. W3I7]
MDDFSALAGVPNQMGVVGTDTNAIEPGKRPLSSMTPTIFLKDDKVALVIGTPGGSRIFTSIFQVVSNVYDFHLGLRCGGGDAFSPPVATCQYDFLGALCADFRATGGGPWRRWLLLG